MSKKESLLQLTSLDPHQGLSFATKDRLHSQQTPADASSSPPLPWPSPHPDHWPEEEREDGSKHAEGAALGNRIARGLIA